MALCKSCGLLFQWGSFDGKWVPLVPITEHNGLDRTYQDEDGELRAHHSSVCTHTAGPAVRVTKLAAKVKAEDILPRKRRKPKLGESTADATTFTLFKKRKVHGYEG